MKSRQYTGGLGDLAASQAPGTCVIRMRSPASFSGFVFVASANTG